MSGRRVREIGGFTQLERHAAERLALAILQRGGRVPIARWATDLPLYQLRIMHREIHGIAPLGGPVGTSIVRYLRTRIDQLHASLFGALIWKHGALDSPQESRADRIVFIGKMVNAYDIYLQMASDSLGTSLDINHAWLLYRDLRCGAAQMAHCDVCDIPYVIVDQGNLPPDCPLCAYYRKMGVPSSRKGYRPAALHPQAGSEPQSLTHAAAY